MTTEDESLAITFNGEIFNYQEVREELVKLGHRFRTQSDTEVILQAYRAWATDCVHHFNGQWAFALHDKKNRRVFLSRDRMGVRPLFYAVTSSALVFASEIKSLMEHPEVPREVDYVSLAQIFTFWCTLPPRTFFKGIQELSPGMSLTIENDRIRTWRYWQLEYRHDADEAAEATQADHLRQLLDDATRIRLRADVPVGAYLSGGIDSTLTTALVKRNSAAELKTFSLSFTDPQFDESHFQSQAVEYLKTNHQSVRCAPADIAECFPEVIWHIEKPVLRTAPAPLFLLAKLVRRHGYKVVVTGEGADEMLGGYDIFKEAKIRAFWSQQPGSPSRPLLLRRLYPYLPNIQGQPEAYRRAFFQIHSGAVSDPFFSHRPRWTMTSKLMALLAPEIRNAIQPEQIYDELLAQLPPGFLRWDTLSRAQYLEAAYLLPGYILSSQGDRMAMAHSVELRMPFLDPRVVEFASGLSPRMRMKVLQEKYLLKRAAAGLIPNSIINRYKQPYRAPEGSSFFGNKPRDYVSELLGSRSLQGYGLFDVAAVANLAAKFNTKRAIGIKDNMGLVGVLSAQLVYQQFIAKSAQDANLYVDRSNTGNHTAVCH